MKKKLFVILTSVMLLVACLPLGAVNVSAAEGDVVCGDVIYMVEDGEAMIRGCVEDFSGELVIPSEVDGYPVTSISSIAFWGNEKLTSVVIPSGVTTIGYQAFFGCIYLEKVTLPKTLKEVDYYAFDDCVCIYDVYYEGSEEDRANIAFVSQSNRLLNDDYVTWHYNQPMPKETDNEKAGSDKGGDNSDNNDSGNGVVWIIVAAVAVVVAGAAALLVLRRKKQ